MASAAEEETERTERVRDKGRVDGLFRACMDEIRASHTIGQSLRHAALAAGLLTDAACYAELLGQFYVATAALEERMDELVTPSDVTGDASRTTTSSPPPPPPLVSKVRDLGYSFKLDYESDLRTLLGSQWRAKVDAATSSPTRRYARRLRRGTDVECAAAAFVLHGPLIVGGGAALKPRVERAFGERASRVFSSVVGTKRGGRAGRRREFVELYDTLLDGGADDDDDDDGRFASIVQACGEFMMLNNEMMLATRQSPWWRNYATAVAVLVCSVFIWYLLPKR